MAEMLYFLTTVLLVAECILAAPDHLLNDNSTTSRAVTVTATVAVFPAVLINNTITQTNSLANGTISRSAYHHYIGIARTATALLCPSDTVTPSTKLKNAATHDYKSNTTSASMRSI